MELRGIRRNEGGLPLIEKIQLKPNGIENQKKTPVLLGEVQWEIIWGYLVRDGRCPDPTNSPDGKLVCPDASMWIYM